MKHKRRDFLKLTSLAGAGTVGTGFLAGCNEGKSEDLPKDDVVRLARRSWNQYFNMCVYSADPIIG